MIIYKKQPMKRLERIKKLLETNYNMKRSKYVYLPKDRNKLKELVRKLIYKHGDNIDLNNIDVSNIKDFNSVFVEQTNFIYLIGMFLKQ
jgi:uncharacterized protein YlbG (UPF0298 family)